jgi:hypothetical protein
VTIDGTEVEAADVVGRAAASALAQARLAFWFAHGPLGADGGAIMPAVAAGVKVARRMVQKRMLRLFPLSHSCDGESMVRIMLHRSI